MSSFVSMSKLFIQKIGEFQLGLWIERNSKLLDILIIQVMLSTTKELELYISGLMENFGMRKVKARDFKTAKQ